MIKVTKLAAKEPGLVVNAELIETIEATPDTVLTMTTGHKIMVRESVDEVVNLVMAYKRAIHRPAASTEQPVERRL